MADGQYLSDKEVNEFLDDLDKNNNGHIEYSEVEWKLDEVHREIAPEAKPHNLHHGDREESERHAFLRSVMGNHKNRIPRDEFANIVRGWKIPSREIDKKAEQDHDEYMKSMPLGRRLRAYWSVEGPEALFIALVVAMQAAFGIWQLVKYLTDMQYRNASCPETLDQMQLLLMVCRHSVGVLWSQRHLQEFCKCPRFLGH